MASFRSNYSTKSMCEARALIICIETDAPRIQYGCQWEADDRSHSCWNRCIQIPDSDLQSPEERKSPKWKKSNCTSALIKNSDFPSRFPEELKVSCEVYHRGRTLDTLKSWCISRSLNPSGKVYLKGLWFYPFVKYPALIFITAFEAFICRLWKLKIVDWQQHTLWGIQPRSILLSGNSLKI